MFISFFLCGCGALKILHYTVGFGNVCFFGLGSLSKLVLVWEEMFDHSAQHRAHAEKCGCECISMLGTSTPFAQL